MTRSKRCVPEAGTYAPRRYRERIVAPLTARVSPTSAQFEDRESTKGSLRGSFLSRKDAHLATFGQKRQCPLQHDEESVREPDQEIDVHACPDNPRRKSGEPEHAKIGERVRTPRDREIALIPVPEGRRRRLSRPASSNQGCHVPSFLNGRLRNARHDHRLFGLDPQQIPRRRNDVRRATNCKNLRMTRQ